LVYSFGLYSARGHEYEVACLKDGADALGQAVLWDGLNVPAEESSIVPAGLAGKRLDPCSRGELGAGFVECNMPVGTNPKNL
jgi:hypothetical protein